MWPWKFLLDNIRVRSVRGNIKKPDISGELNATAEEVVMKDIANERALMKHYKKQFQFIRNSVNAVCSEEGERKPKSRWATKCEKDYDMFNSIQ